MSTPVTCASPTGNTISQPKSKLNGNKGVRPEPSRSIDKITTEYSYSLYIPKASNSREATDNIAQNIKTLLYFSVFSTYRLNPKLDMRPIPISSPPNRLA
jgi:hypothetical protein